MQRRRHDASSRRRWRRAGAGCLLSTTISAASIASKSRAWLQPAERARAARAASRRQRPGALRDVEAEPAVVETRALADREALHPVLVVADEDERRASHGPRAPSTDRRTLRNGKRRNAASVAQTNAGHLPRPSRCCWRSRSRTMSGYRPRLELLMKIAAVDLADVDRADRARARCAATACVELERDAEVLGEVVERAERQHAEGDAGCRRAPRRPC